MANKFWPFGKKDILEDTLGLTALEDAKKQMSDAVGADSSAPTMYASDFTALLDDRIKCLTQRLTSEIDHPSWGPKGSKRQHKKEAQKELAELNGQNGAQKAAMGSGQYAGTLNIDENTKISQNLDQSERYFQYSWLYLGAIIFGLMVTVGALYVDYQIMNEFWTRILANEFMEVPPALGNTVISKSAQVIFATAAFHFFIGKLPDWGRTTFIVIFFAMTATMIAGFGLLNANISMPSDPAEISLTPSSSADDAPSLNDALVALGLGEPEAPEVATPAAVTDAPRQSQFVEAGYFIQDVQPFLWMFVPGLVFLIVTGIGALCLHMAEHNIENFVKSLDYPKRKARVSELAELRRYRAVAKNMEGKEGTASRRSRSRLQEVA